MNTAERTPGYYDNAGPAVMDAWLRAMLKRTLADAMPAEFFKWYSATGYPTTAAPSTGSINLTVGVKVLFNALAGPDAGVPQGYDFFNGRDPRRSRWRRWTMRWPRSSRPTGPGGLEGARRPHGLRAQNFLACPRPMPRPR